MEGWVALLGGRFTRMLVCQMFYPLFRLSPSKEKQERVDKYF
jgi:hypothetical protein